MRQIIKVEIHRSQRIRKNGENIIFRPNLDNEVSMKGGLKVETHASDNHCGFCIFSIL